MNLLPSYSVSSGLLQLMADRIRQHYSLPPLELLVMIASLLDSEHSRLRFLPSGRYASSQKRYVIRIISLYDENESCEAFKSIMHTHG
jgi:hypothetical protein